MYNSDAVKEIIRKSRNLNCREVMHALGYAKSMDYPVYSKTGGRTHRILDENSSFVDVEPIEMVKFAFEVDTVQAAYWLNAVFGLGVKEGVTPDEYARMVADEAEALRRENAAFLNEGTKLLDRACAHLNEKKPSSWAYKALENAKISLLREKLIGGKWESDVNERRFISDNMRALENVCRALEAAQ